MCADAMQTLESALNMCCGNYQGLVSQFQEAGEHPILPFPISLQSLHYMTLAAEGSCSGLFLLSPIATSMICKKFRDVLWQICGCLSAHLRVKERL